MLIFYSQYTFGSFVYFWFYILYFMDAAKYICTRTQLQTPRYIIDESCQRNVVSPHVGPTVRSLCAIRL